MKGIPSLANGIPTARSATEPSVLGFVDQLVLFQPGHHRPQPPTDFFDWMGFPFCQQRIVDWAVRLVLQHPLFGKLALLDFTQDLLHLLLRLLCHYPRTTGNITVFGRRTDRISHVGNTTLVNQIYDQFYLMQALEIGHLRRIAGFHERLVAGLNKGREPSTEHNLFPEEIGFGFFTKVCFDHTGPPPPDRTGIGKAHLLGCSARVLMDREQARYPTALRIFRSNEMAGPFRSDHEHIDRRRGYDLSKVNIKAVAKGKIGSWLQI